MTSLPTRDMAPPTSEVERTTLPTAREARRVPPAAAAPADDRLGRRAWLLLSGALVLLLANALVPMEEFVHRGDDAFYYFKVAANYPRHGFWTFDGIHPTNGVQPLWAMILTGIAQLLAWVGMDDPDVLARGFVALTALCHFAACVLLYGLLARTVSVGTGIAAAGAFLFPLGIVWARVWGMENSLYALTLVAAVYYFHLVFRERESAGTAALAGALLGLTALSRLNAGLLIPVVLVYYVLRRTRTPLPHRLRMAVVMGAAASALIVPYLVANYVATGYPLPISGVVKDVRVAEFLAGQGVESRFSKDFLSMLYWNFQEPVLWFLKARALDGLWIVGARIALPGVIGMAGLALLIGGLALLPALLGPPREWLRLLRDRFARLSAFSYVLLFGIVNAVVSVLKYPIELRYAMTRWWLVENEIVVVAVTATLAAASLAFVASRWIPGRWRPGLATAGIGLLVVLHAAQTARFYWDGEMDREDWNRSWNDESYRAARWISRNLPAGALVGSWNAGVLGYYAERPVVNLDGLINNAELLPFIEEDRVDRYVLREGISYLSDMDAAIERSGVGDHLRLTEVYSHRSEFARMTYKIYRVDR